MSNESGKREFRVGDLVVKNESGWVPSEFDAWESGVGTGEVVGLDGDLVDVRWPAGRSCHKPSEISPAPESPFAAKVKKDQVTDQMIEAVENAVGMARSAWDMVNHNELIAESVNAWMAAQAKLNAK